MPVNNLTRLSVEQQEEVRCEMAHELLLAGGWVWLHKLAMTSPHASPACTRVIGQVFGGVMGILLALSPLLYLVALRNDKR